MPLLISVLCLVFWVLHDFSEYFHVPEFGSSLQSAQTTFVILMLVFGKYFPELLCVIVFLKIVPEFVGGFGFQSFQTTSATTWVFFQSSQTTSAFCVFVSPEFSNYFGLRCFCISGVLNLLRRSSGIIRILFFWFPEFSETSLEKCRPSLEKSEIAITDLHSEPSLEKTEIAITDLHSEPCLEKSEIEITDLHSEPCLEKSEIAIADLHSEPSLEKSKKRDYTLNEYA